MLTVMAEPPLLLALDLTGTFAFALNGAITGLEAAKLDIIGMLTLGMITALGGGILRNILINALPPATFSSWPYLAVAAGGALIAFFLSRQLHRFTLPIELLDAAGLSLFCVTGATKSLELPPRRRAGRHPRSRHRRRRRDDPRHPGPAGPDSLTSGLYAIPALIGAAIAVAAVRTGVYGVPAALGAAAACFLIRLAGIHCNINAPSRTPVPVATDVTSSPSTLAAKSITPRHWPRVSTPPKPGGARDGGGASESWKVDRICPGPAHPDIGGTERRGELAQALVRQVDRGARVPGTAKAPSPSASYQPVSPGPRRRSLLHRASQNLPPMISTISTLYDWKRSPSRPTCGSP